MDLKGTAKDAAKRQGKRIARGAAVKGAAWLAGASAPVLLPALALVIVMVILMALLSSQGSGNDPWAPVQAASTSCGTTSSTGTGSGSLPGGGGATGGLTAKQYSIEKIIVQQGLDNHIPDLGIISALDTGHQETDFHDYASKSDPPSLTAPDSDGPPATNGGYGDHGSLGVFQQQTDEPPMDNPYEPATANWGSWQQLMDPATSADLYYQALLQKDAMAQSDNPGLIAQIVQVSATPTAYIQWTADSEAAFRQVTGQAPNLVQPSSSTGKVNVTVGDGTTNGGVTSCPTSGSSSGSTSITAYKNPFRSVKGLTMTRIDQGVDAYGSGPVYPLTDAVIVSHFASGWCGGCTSPDSYTVVKVTDGPAKGKYIYYAEACTLDPGYQVGSTVSVSKPLCVMNPTSIEFGWAQGPQNELPSASAWYQTQPDGSETNYGRNFNALIVAVGGPTAHHQPGTSVEQGNAPGLPAKW